MSEELSYSLMQEVIEKISETDIFDALARNGTLVDFISKVWPVWDMPSSDRRFKTKAEDIQQHYVRNSDYTWKHLFINELKLLSTRQNYGLFLNSLTCKELYKSEKEFQEIIKLFKEILSNHKLYLKEQSFHVKNQPCFNITSEVQENLLEVLPNKYSIFYCSKSIRKGVQLSVFPCFLLLSDSWNDYGVFSLFHLYYYTSKDTCIEIGRVKILYINSSNEVDSFTAAHLVEGEFKALDSNFVSLGQDISYYETLKKYLNIDEAKSLLYALNDCALFPDNLNKVVHYEQYLTSLTRQDSAAKAVHLARLIFSGKERKDLYKINITYVPPYSDESTSIDFHFDSELMFPRRVYCLIGRNGAGKTQLLSRIPDLIKKKFSISPFTKYLYISTCYSEFFSKPKIVDPTTIFESCGLLEFDNDRSIIKTVDQLKKEITKNIQKLVLESRENRLDYGQVDRLKSLLTALQILFTPDKIQGLFIENKSLNLDAINKLCEHLSSGEMTLLYVITSIISKIQMGALLLFDEPETHLHPNAVSQMMNVIYELLEQFNSYAIIATHSPLVIREVQANSVMIVHKIDNQCIVRKIAQESLGGDLSGLTREVFGANEDQLYYKQKIIRLRQANISVDRIRKEIQSEGIPLGIGLDFFIANCF